ncbi:LysR family transcriptional regulator [Collinsella ihumii]|uniref:LysR family transcriptional regulator n=1 Tax=Collinsella ihumii TaxID=1720204 RepID=UPI0011C91F83|nr:LysR family transcriptional regulator [Collinsella ihumii]
MQSKGASMNIKDYSYIAEIADQGSLTTAADRLCITQSALSKSLHRIEDELGTPLFYRRGRRLVLTPIGQVYVDHAKQIMRVDEELENRILQMKNSEADSIRLGFGMGFADFVFDELLPRYFALPHVRSISVREGGSASLLTDLENNRIDVCLAYGPRERPGLDYTMLRTCRLVLAVPDKSPLILQAVPREGYPYPVLEGDGWLEKPFIHIITRTQSGAAAQRFFTELGKWPNNRMYVRDVRGALNAVTHALGNAIVAEPPFTHAGYRYLCLPGLSEPEKQICMVTVKGNQADPSLLYLQETIQSLFGHDA